MDVVKVMNRVALLWRQGMVPGFAGLYRANDAARSIEIDGAALTSFRVGAPFDFAERLAADSGYLAEIDESARVALPFGGGFVCCGEGAHGSEGFFARLDADGDLVWVVFLPDGNPFYEVNVHGSRITCTNNLGRRVSVDLTDELYA
jgi:hypothetical protein